MASQKDYVLCFSRGPELIQPVDKLLLIDGTFQIQTEQGKKNKIHKLILIRSGCNPVCTWLTVSSTECGGLTSE